MASKKHDFTVTEVKAGVTVLASVVVLALFFAAVKGLRLSPAEVTFLSEFSDTKGLDKGAEVRFGGVKVGRVASLTPSKRDQSKILVKWRVKRGVPVNSDSEAYIGQVSLASSKHLEVTTGTNDAEVLEDGASVPVRPFSGGMTGAFDRIADAVGRALGPAGIAGDLRRFIGVPEGTSVEEKPVEFVSLSRLVKNVDGAVVEGSALVEDLKAAIGESQEDIELILREIREVEKASKHLLEEAEAMLEENRPGLRESVNGIRKLVEDARARLRRSSGRLDQVLEDAQSISSRVRRTTEENAPLLSEVLSDFEVLLRSLKEFSRTISEQPSSLIRGKAPQGRK